MTQADLDNYEVKVQSALEGTYRGRKIYTTHAPTSGPALIHMLNLLERFNDFVGDGRTALNVHRMIEIIKCALAPLVHCRSFGLTYLSWFCGADEGG